MGGRRKGRKGRKKGKGKEVGKEGRKEGGKDSESFRSDGWFMFAFNLRSKAD